MALASTIDSLGNIHLVERAFMGGLPLIVSLLEQVTAIEAQASLCAVIANLAKSTTVLAVMTEQRVRLIPLKVVPNSAAAFRYLRMAHSTPPRLRLDSALTPPHDSSGTAHPVETHQHSA
jgi:hypothetical protein